MLLLQWNLSPVHEAIIFLEGFFDFRKTVLVVGVTCHFIPILLSLQIQHLLLEQRAESLVLTFPEVTHGAQVVRKSRLVADVEDQSRPDGFLGYISHLGDVAPSLLLQLEQPPAAHDSLRSNASLDQLVRHELSHGSQFFV